MKRLPRRLTQLYCGLVLCGVSMAMMVRAGLGLDPWDVFHQGMAERTGLSMGMVTNLTGLAVLLLWIPLRERPGLGTVSNVLLVGTTMDLALPLFPHPSEPVAQVALMLAAVLLNGVATGLYITGRFGPGPRDGVMTALHRRTGRSVRLVRTGIEVTVLVVGVVLGGTAGVGTVVYALAIGPLSQFFLRLFAVPDAGYPERHRVEPGGESGMDFEERRMAGILRLRSRRTDRYPEPSRADAG
ncbi:YczE/YyaS/YitT family protein [Streptomyces sp. MS19]|uniref:membrane protein YczE n=1 Tax=Streptomyces sp. MS19 TaxID=3385972 RepID=UPI0039A3D0AB